MAVDVSDQKHGGRGRLLSGKVAIVTGAGRTDQHTVSSGHAVALTLARQGARVAVVNRNQVAAGMTVAEIGDEGGESAALIGDLTRAEDCERVVGETLRRFGAIDILVNNLGLTSKPMGLVDFDHEYFGHHMAVNVMSILMMTKYCVPSMKAGGAIVNVSSIHAVLPGPSILQGIAKAAVEALTRGIALECGPRGIRANCVRPGQVWSTLTMQSLGLGGMSPEAVEQIRESRMRGSLLQTEGTPWDVADAVLFLSSDLSRWITAHVLSVDGGLQIIQSERGGVVGATDSMYVQVPVVAAQES
jgi:NAD(P)-dependent dehydrogenase (short-subunit alcohol dehydrogenase family)